MAKAQRRGNKEAKIKALVAAPSELSRGVLATAIASPKVKTS